MPPRSQNTFDELPPRRTRLTCQSVRELIRDVFAHFILVPILIKLGRAPTKDRYMSSEIEQTLRLKHVRVMSVVIYLTVIATVASGVCYYYASIYHPCVSKMFHLENDWLLTLED